MTVSRVVNGSARVRPETRQRVQEAIAALGYVPNNLARGLTRQKTGALALIVPDFADPFFTLILRGAEDVARRAGYRVILCNTDGDLEREDAYLEDMVAHRVEGLLIAPVGNQSRRNLRRLGPHPPPFVLVDRSIPGIESDLVQGDSVGGARVLVDHLLGLGHRRIAHITESQDVSTARDRLRGYTDALAAAGIPVDPALVEVAAAANAEVATRRRNACSTAIPGPAPSSPSTTSRRSGRYAPSASAGWRSPPTSPSSVSTTSSWRRCSARSSR